MKIMELTLFTNKDKALMPNSIIQSVEMLYNNIKAYKNGEGYEIYNVLKVGRMLEGRAYFHETHESYGIIGYEVEYESKFKFQTEKEVSIGFIPVWVGKCSKYASICFQNDFQELGKAHVFDNGSGDKMEVLRVIAPENLVRKAIQMYVEYTLKQRQMKNEKSGQVKLKNAENLEIKECEDCNFNCTWCYDIKDNLCNYVSSQVSLIGEGNIPRMQNKECKYEECELYGKCSNCSTKK